MKQGKQWGETVELCANHAMALHRMVIKAHGYCSRHQHAHKWNGFFVERGEMVVKVWQPSGTLDETRLGPGDVLYVPPGVDHQFVALTDTVAFEWYWLGPLEEDIIRRSVGGLTLPPGQE